jgi:hypothetical protein
MSRRRHENRQAQRAPLKATNLTRFVQSPRKFIEQNARGAREVVPKIRRQVRGEVVARHHHEVQAPNLGNKAFYFVAWEFALYRVKLIGRPEGGAGHFCLTLRLIFFGSFSE